MSEEVNRFVVEIDGKDLKSVTGKVKGRIQERIKNMHRYPEATFVLHRTEGVIQVTGVPEDALDQALRSVVGDLHPKSHFTYTIEKYVPEEVNDEAHEDLSHSDELNARFAIWIEQAQKEWKSREQGYISEISRLGLEKKRLMDECMTLREVGKRGEEIADALKKDKAQLASMYENAASQLIQPPEEASRIWVGDWSRIATNINESLSGAEFGDKGKEIPGLMNFTLSELHAAILKKLPEGSNVQKDLQAIESLARVSPFEQTEEYSQRQSEYKRAKDETDYLKGIEEGLITVPESIKETLSKSVDLRENLRVIEEFESLRKKHDRRTEEASEIESLLDRYQNAESLRGIRLTMAKERPLPVIISCDRGDGNWVLRIMLPSAEGIVRDSYTDCVRSAAKDAGLKKPDITSSENLTYMLLPMPGNIKSWKDASRKQESFAWDLISQFRNCPLSLLGVKIKITKMMDLTPPTEPVKLDLPSQSEPEDDRPPTEDTP